MQDLGTQFHFHDGAMTVQRSQDCTAIAEDAKARSSSGLTGSSEMKHAARIPLVMVEKYCNDNKIEFSEFMQNNEHIRRVLNDPAMSHFRIWKGAI